MLDTCDLSPGGTKAEAAARLVDFLEAPHDSGEPPDPNPNPNP